MTLSARIQIGVSSCLLGQAVRYDGRHKRQTYIVRTLARRFELIAICPEVGIGMGVPRPAIQLVGYPGARRAVGRDDATLDVTTKLTAYGRRQARALANVSGYIFKSRSPSCGLYDVAVYNGAAIELGRGIYAETFLSRHPWLPIAEESVFNDRKLRSNFLARVFIYRRWQELIARGLTAVRLAQFHEAHAALIAIRSSSVLKILESLVVDARRHRAQKTLASNYLAAFMGALSGNHDGR